MDNGLSSHIEQLRILRADKKRAEFELKELTKKVDLMEWEIIQSMDELKLMETKTSAAKVSIREATHAKVEDWSIFHRWILDGESAGEPRIHFLQKRPAELAYREALSIGLPVQGVVPFVKRKLYFKES